MMDRVLRINDKELFVLLKLKIQDIRKEKQLIQYHSIGESTIKDIVKYKPHTIKNLMLIKGIGKYKAEIYGKDILEIINKYYPYSGPEDENEITSELINEMKYKKKLKKNNYYWWENEYPGYVVIKKEGRFRTIRGENAELVGDLTGFKVGDNRGTPITGCPNLDFIRDVLISNCVSFIVVENEECIEKWG